MSHINGAVVRLLGECEHHVINEALNRSGVSPSCHEALSAVVLEFHLKLS